MQEIHCIALDKRYNTNTIYMHAIKKGNTCPIQIHVLYLLHHCSHKAGESCTSFLSVKFLHGFNLTYLLLMAVVYEH
jgi:hypothetical protein